jgi:NAD(P)H-nitrite reductase large subunit
MDLDAEICVCFHVTRRKLLSFVRTERPSVPSQLSQCGGAGTGCGWCVPFLQHIFDEVRGVTPGEIDRLSPHEYRRQREEYIQSDKVRRQAETQHRPRDKQ